MCKFFFATGNFCNSNTSQWWDRSPARDKRTIESRANLWRRPCMKSRIFENFVKSWSWWAFWASNSMKFLRWREFHCLAAPRWSVIWLVERYACRVIPRRGWFCNRLAEMVMVFFGRSSSIFSKRARSFAQPVFFTGRIRSGGAIDRWNEANELQAKELWWTNGFSWNIDLWKFHEKLTLVNRLVIKFNEFSSLARISLLCGVAHALTHDS